MPEIPTYEELEQRVWELEEAESNRMQTERAFQQTIEWFQLAHRAAHCGIWEWDLKTNKNDWSDEIWELYDLPPHSRQPSYDAWLETVHPDDRKRTAQEVHNAASLGLGLKTEWRVNTKDQSERWLTARGELIQKPGGQGNCYVGVVMDISEFKQAGETLRGSEDRFRAIVEGAPDAVFVQTEKKFAYLNSRAVSLFGAEKATDLLGRSVMDRFHPDYHTKILERIRRLNENRQPVLDRLEQKFLRLDGSEVWVETTGQPILFEGKKGALVFVRNITERKQAEEVLKESERRNKFLAGIIKEGSQPVAVGYPDGRLGLMNRAFELLMGYSAEELQSMDWAKELTPPEWLPMELAKLEELHKTGNPVLYEKEYVRKDGTRVPVELLVHLAKTPDGKPEYYYAYITNITDRRRSQKEILERENYLKTILQTTIDGFWVVDSNGSFTEVNEAYCRMSGYARDEFLAMSISDIDVVEKSEETATRIRFIREHGSQSFETRHRRKNGTIFDVQVSANYLGADTEHFVCFARDITERKKMEAERSRVESQLRQAQKLEAIGTLAGGIAHDFNNILFPIVGIAELLLEDHAPGSAAYEAIEEIVRAGKRGSELVKQILAFSRRSEQKKIPIHIQQVLKEALKLSRSTIPTNIRIQQDIQKDCPMVLADPTQIHQVAMNLITNAYHAVEMENGQITVKLTKVEINPGDLPDSSFSPGEYAVLTVSDTGIGITPESMDKIFEPYFTTKEQGKGTGLGLAVVYGILKEHHGDIKVCSELGKGTTFIVYLPIMAKGKETESLEKEEASPVGNERILLVDDEVAIANLEKRILSRLGYRVEAHTKSAEALEAFVANPTAFDLVISDMSMPNMTGEKLACEMISIRPDIPIIICTGFSEKIDEKAIRSKGIKGFLMKPVLKSVLAKTVRKVLDSDRASIG